MIPTVTYLPLRWRRVDTNPRFTAIGRFLRNAVLPILLGYLKVGAVVATFIALIILATR